MTTYKLDGQKETVAIILEMPGVSHLETFEEDLTTIMCLIEVSKSDEKFVVFKMIDHSDVLEWERASS